MPLMVFTDKSNRSRCVKPDNDSFDIKPSLLCDMLHCVRAGTIVRIPGKSSNPFCDKSRFFKLFIGLVKLSVESWLSVSVNPVKLTLTNAVSSMSVSPVVLIQTCHSATADEKAFSVILVNVGLFDSEKICRPVSVAKSADVSSVMLMLSMISDITDELKHGKIDSSTVTSEHATISFVHVQISVHTLSQNPAASKPFVNAQKMPIHTIPLRNMVAVLLNFIFNFEPIGTQEPLLTTPPNRWSRDQTHREIHELINSCCHDVILRYLYVHRKVRFLSRGETPKHWWCFTFVIREKCDRTNYYTCKWLEIDNNCLGYWM